MINTIMNGETKFEKEDVRNAIKLLPAQYREAIHLRFWERLTIEEVSKTMRISWSEANRTIDDALILLKKILMEQMKN